MTCSVVPHLCRFNAISTIQTSYLTCIMHLMCIKFCSQGWLRELEPPIDVHNIIMKLTCQSVVKNYSVSGSYQMQANFGALYSDD